jgi:hypothetical protein
VNIQEIDLKSLRASISLVPQAQGPGAEWLDALAMTVVRSPSFGVDRWRRTWILLARCPWKG